MRVDVTRPAEGARARDFQPRALIVTIYGLSARNDSGWLSVAALIRLMAELGVDEPAVRSSISRLKRREILVPERRAAVAGYGLSDTAISMLDDGDRRIFQRPRAKLEDGWLLAVFSVPESERRQRHTLRSQLGWLGFGTVSAGVWVAPAHLETEALRVLTRFDLTAYVHLFRADHLAFGDVAEQAARWWDLEALRAGYDTFLEVFGPVLTGWRRRRSDMDDIAFRDFVSALTAWRLLPFLDPGLPDEVLPSRWPDQPASELFAELSDKLAGPAARFVESVR